MLPPHHLGRWYNLAMASLAQTNKYLATAALRKRAVRVTIATSSAIEGIFAPFRPTVPRSTKVVATKKIDAKQSSVKVVVAKAARKRP